MRVIGVPWPVSLRIKCVAILVMIKLLKMGTGSITDDFVEKLKLY